VEWARDFAKRLVEQKGEKVALMQLRGLIPHFFSGFPGYKKIRAEIAMNIKTFDDLTESLMASKIAITFENAFRA
jgi:tRNA-dihydrouridine synthase